MTGMTTTQARPDDQRPAGRRRRPQRTERTYRVVNRLFAIIFGLLGLRITVRGAENVPATGPGVLACNHVGFLDFTFVGYAARERRRFVRFMSKRSIFDNRIAGPAMRAMRHIPVDRPSGAVAYRHGLDRLAAGDLVGMFPEATISRSFCLRPLKHGAAALALARDVPLIPVVVWGSHRVLTVDGRRSLRRGTAISILVGEPLHPGTGETRQRLTERLRLSMDELLKDAVDTYPQVPRNDEDRWWLPADKGGTAPDPENGLRLDQSVLTRSGQLFD